MNEFKLERLQQKVNDYCARFVGLPLYSIKVTFHLAAPVYANSPIQLDALIAYFMFQNALEDQAKNCLEGLTFTLPLKLVGVDPEQFWAASYLWPEGDKLDGLASWKKRWEDQHDDLVEARPDGRLHVDHKAGFFKAYQIPIPYVDTRTMVAYCIGHLSTIQEYLSQCQFLGKKRSQGWGELRSITVAAHDDPEAFWYKDGKTTRHVPYSFVPNGFVQNIVKSGKPTSIRMTRKRIIPPYWAIGNEVNCFMLE